MLPCGPCGCSQHDVAAPILPRRPPGRPGCSELIVYHLLGPESAPNNVPIRLQVRGMI